MGLINKQDLYEKVAEWEAQALHMVEKTMYDENPTEWKKWSTILTERSAFKYDVANAPLVQQWIPLKTRPMDEEERKEWSEKLGYDIDYDEAVIYVSQLPDDQQVVLTCNQYGTIAIDTFEQDPDYGCSFYENGDMDGIIAWMPLPEPYKEETK